MLLDVNVIAFLFHAFVLQVGYSFQIRLNPEQLEIEIDLRFEEDLQETPEPLKLQKQVNRRYRVYMCKH